MKAIGYIPVESTRNNAGLPVARLNVTDRALRYRANEEPPEGPEICAMCGSKHFVEIDHIDGFEEHGEPENLMWLCRSCNTRKGIGGSGVNSPSNLTSTSGGGGTKSRSEKGGKVYGGSGQKADAGESAKEALDAGSTVGGIWRETFAGCGNVATS